MAINREQEKFIKISDIQTNKRNIDENTIHKNSIDIYQIQGIPNQSLASIISVGNMVESNDILIKQFILYDDYTCYIVSKLYSIEHIKELHNHKLFQMVRMNIWDKTKLICWLAFNFCPILTSSSSSSSSSLSLMNLEGHFSITLHYDNKYIILEELQTYCGNEIMMVKLTEYLLSEIPSLLIRDS